MKPRVTVLVVDDSALVCQVYRRVLESDAQITVQATASDPFEAVKCIAASIPDVMIVDVEMPRMDGITFLRKVMQQHPIPTIVCSSFTALDSSVAFEAARAGAVEVLEKPANLRKDPEFAGRLVAAVKVAAVARVRGVRNERLRLRGSSSQPQALVESAGPRPSEAATRRVGQGIVKDTRVARPKVVAIGASTGGTEAIRRVLSPLNSTLPPIVIVQHMPAGFTASFANWLNQCCKLRVVEAKDGLALSSGDVAIAQGGIHLRVRNRQRNVVTVLGAEPPVNRHRPSVDVMFDSVALEFGGQSQGILLTGMGDDGALGLLRLHQAGALTIAESEESAVVFGMPKEAIARGAAEQVLSLDEISQLLGSIPSDEVT